MLHLKIWTFRSVSVLLILITVIAVTSLFCFKTPADLSPANQEFIELESYITAEMKKNQVPGLSVTIFNAHEIVYSKGFGVKNIKTVEPVDTDTIFEAASFSKTLTAYAALKLVEKGSLSLDEPLNQYLEREYLPESGYAGRITLRMVLNHTSGLSNDSDGKDRKVRFTPGDHFSYSGAGFRYLQEVIESVTGFPFNEFIDREIIRSLAMNSSSFVMKDEMLPFMANGHIAERTLRVAPISRMTENAAYSLLATTTDMAKFNMELCDPTLLKPETVALMLRPSVKWTGDLFWGLGIGIVKTPNGDFFWHWGNNYEYRNLMVTGKDAKSGVIIMTNSTTGMKVARRLAVKIINEYCGGRIEIGTFDLLQ